MSLPEVATRAQWLEARKALLAREKEFTRQKDVLNADRRRLPMVAVEKDYTFEGPAGTMTLADLFDGHAPAGRLPLHVRSGVGRGLPRLHRRLRRALPGLLEHLGARDTAYAVVARAPYEKIAAYKEKRGWTFPFFSSNGSDFNYDFHATIDESKAPMEINYRARADLEAPEASKLHWILEQEQPFENPGFSFFLRDGDAIFHTNSTFARGTEECSDSYGILDHTALGRQEDWEEPKGRADDPHPAVPDFAEGTAIGD